MPNINSLTYNGMKSTDLGVYVTGSGSFDAAEMDADKYEIAGRNGDLIIPKNRYKNIVVTYPAFIPKAFQEKAQSIRNWMRSAKAYARLEDTYDMEHYRLGLASGIQSFEPVNRNDASNFQLSFDCKPQRFLKTGETPLPIEPEAHSYSGEIVSFETVAVDDMTKAEVSLSPIQSLNGYDHPWAGGAGVNKLPCPAAGTETANGVTVVTDGNGKYTLSGTASADTNIYFNVSGTFPSTCFVHLLNNKAVNPAIVIIYFYDGNTSIDSVGLTSINRVYNGTPYIADKALTRIRVRILSGGNVDGYVFTPMVLETNEVTAFSPYENLCPISGHTGATLNVAGKNLLENNIVDGTASGVTFAKNTDGSVSCSGNPTSTSAVRAVNDNIVLPNGTYVLSGTGSVMRMRINRYDKNNTLIDRISDTGNGATVVVDDNVGKLYCGIIAKQMGAMTDTVYPMLRRVEDTDATYEPYQGDIYPVTFGQTVYGGTFDFVSGDGQSKWANIASYNGETLPGRWLSDRDVYAAGTTPTIGAQVVYELATPIEIDLDPTEVQTLLGLNNVWASDGTVEINYADPFNVDNPTYFEARPLFEITNPAQGDILNVNGKTITFLSSYTGTVTIDCETMNCYSGYANMNYLISATDFPVLNEGLNIVTWSGSGTCTMTPRWWEL